MYQGASNCPVTLFNESKPTLKHPKTKALLSLPNRNLIEIH